MCKEIREYAEGVAMETAVKTALKYNASEAAIITDLMTDYHLTEEEAKGVLKEYS